MTTEAKEALAIWGGLLFGAVLYLLADKDDPDEGSDPVDAEIGVTAVATGTLTGNAAAAEAELLRAYPGAVVTSERRDVGSQAGAMASNVVSNRQWIAQTYVQSVARDLCQSWVDGNPDVTDQASIAAGLQGVLEPLTAAQLHNLSWHLTGQAFDVRPGTCPQSAVQSLADQHKTNGGRATFLTREAGLSRWHIQFDDTVSTQFSLSNS